MKFSSEEIFSGLNSEQRGAVTFGEGPMLVVAGAGTGKTSIITQRIAYLIASKKAKPEEILALTFTDKAASEMEERVDILVPYGYTNIWISTFHAFGDRVLRDYAFDIGLDPEFNVLSRPEQIIFFREHLFKFQLNFYRPLGDPTKFIDVLIGLFSRSKDEDISPEAYKKYAETLKSNVVNNGNLPSLESSNKQYEIAQAYSEYQDLLMKEGKVDFGNQVYLTLKLLRSSPSILQNYQKRFCYILVDEFQDTNLAQFELLKLLSKTHKNINVVGDDDQSIYKFRGGAISNILNFKKEYPNAKEIVLKKNYRSTQIILDTAYRLITNNNPNRLEARYNIDKRLISEKFKSGGKEAELFFFDTLSSEADGVAEIVNKKVKDEQFRYSDFAILVRSNNDANPFIRSLNMHSIPHKFSGSKGLYDREEIKLLISFFKTIANPYDSPNLYYLASSEIYKINPIDLAKCMNYASRKKRPLYEILSNISQVEEISDIIENSGNKIDKLLRDITNYLQHSVKCSTGELLYEFIMDTGYLAGLNDAEDIRAEDKIKNIAKFFDILRGYNEVSIHDRVNNFVEHLNMMIYAGDDPPVAESDYEVDAVSVMTVHKAKGLEFRVVFMVSLVDLKFPTRRRKNPLELPVELIKEELPKGDFHLQEERRLFYVGMTRAKEELCFTAARDYGGNKPRKLSPFVLEALDLSKPEITPFKASSEEVIKRNAPPAEKTFTEVEKISEEKIMTLSFFQIDDYLTCPLKYKYVHILRIPVLQHHTVAYGKALHDAISEYFKRKLQNKKMTLEEFLKIFESVWINEGFLTRDHEELRLTEGKNALSIFYENEETSFALPTYIEKDFNFRIGNEKVIGRWDRIDINDGKAAIIDYKSSDVREQKKADKRAKDSLQLGIYALAYYEIYHQLPDFVELHFIRPEPYSKENPVLVGRVKKGLEDFDGVKEKIIEAATGIRVREWKAKPSYMACRYCAFAEICPEKFGG